MEKVKTATGQEFDIEFCGSIGDAMNATLYIEIVGKSFLTVVNVFGLPSENSKIEQYDEDGTLTNTFVGFTSLEEARVMHENGNIKIRLEKRIEM